MLFGYLSGSARVLLARTLPLRYCAARFACRTPTWRLPVPGCVVDLVTASVGAVREVVADGGCRDPSLITRGGAMTGRRGFGSCSDQYWGGMISWFPCR